MNPFELRYAVFYSAKEILEAQYKANLAAWDLLNKTSKETEALAPTFPTLEEIIDKAIQINKFVSDSGEKELAKAVKSLKGFGAPV